MNSLNDDKIIIDSLKNVLLKSKSDSIKCITSFKLSAIYYKNNELNQQKQSFEIAKALIKENKFLNDISFYYEAMFSSLSNNDDVMNNYRKAYYLANSKLKKYKLKEVYSIRATILFNIALSYQRQSYDLKAIKILLDEAIPLAQKSNDKQEISNQYLLVSVIFYNRDDLQKAENYIKLAIETLESRKNKEIGYFEDIIEFYLFYAEIKSIQKEYTKAFNYLYKAKSILNDYPESNLHIEYYRSEATLLKDTNKYEKALNSIDKGLIIAKKLNYFYAFDELRFIKFEILKALHRYNEAKTILVEALNSNYLVIENKRTYTKELAIVYGKLNDLPNSIKYYEKYISINDSLNELNSKDEIFKLEAKFNNSEKEKKILSLKKEKLNAELKAKNNQLTYLLFGLFSTILMIVSYFLWKNNKNQKRLSMQKEINYKQNLENFQKEKELEIMQAMIDGEELERKRIARDLHDGIGSRLTSLKMQMSQMENEEKNNSNYKMISDSLSNSINDLRQTAFNLVPETLLKLGLELAIRDLCYTMSSPKVSIEFICNEIQNSIKETNQITIFRIVQELLINAIKHSNCTEIIVDCSQNEHLFLITIEDNGIGFNTNDIDCFTGLGLKNIRNRVDLLKGKLEINSNSYEGTIFNIELKTQTKDEKKI